MLDNQVPDLGGKRVPVWVVTLVAGLSMVLAAVNAYLSINNSRFGAEVRERQQVIGQAIQLSPLNEQLTQLIGSLATQSGDIDLRTVLERHGITLNQAPAPGGGSVTIKP